MTFFSSYIEYDATDGLTQLYGGIIDLEQDYPSFKSIGKQMKHEYQLS